MRKIILGCCRAATTFRSYQVITFKMAIIADNFKMAVIVASFKMAVIVKWAVGVLAWLISSGSSFSPHTLLTGRGLLEARLLRILHFLLLGFPE